MTGKNYLTAKEAAAALGINVQTLYAYVSRGLIRSEAGEGKSRARRYRQEDVAALQARKELRRNPAKAAEGALHWGTPVLESGITLIENGRLYYRGYDVIPLPDNHTFADVARLIWQNNLPAGTQFEMDPGHWSLTEKLWDHLEQLSPVERFQAVLPFAAAADLGAYDLSDTAVVQTGTRLISLMTTAAAGQPVSGSVAASLQHSWLPADTVVTPLLNAALIYCADHELNVSAFTARTVASARATPYAVVMAGLAALQGSLHGGATERVAAFLHEVGSPDNARAAIASRLRRGEVLPGFGHPLYPNGDPRGKALLARVAGAFPEQEALLLAQRLVTEVETAVNKKPNIDFALVTLAWAAGLPPGAPLALFALGRTVGWIGHALEQYGRHQLIRPRARYTGVLPGEQ